MSPLLLLCVWFLGQGGVPETLNTVPLSLTEAAASSPWPDLAGEMVGLLTKLAASSFWSKVFLGGGVVPEGEGASLSLFRACSGVRAGRPGASPGDLAPRGRWCSKGGRLAGRESGSPQPLLPRVFCWRMKSSLPKLTRKFVVLLLSSLAWLPMLLMVLNLTNRSWGMYLTTSTLSSPVVPRRMAVVKDLVNSAISQVASSTYSPWPEQIF